MREEFLELYTANLCRLTCLFEGMAETLDALEQQRHGLGRGHQQARALHRPADGRAGPGERAASIISGDTCSHPKPHPEPLLCASREIGLAPEQCAYVGDAERDMEAAIAAGMRPIVALYGYLGADDHPEEWRAHGTRANTRWNYCACCNALLW